MRLRLYGARPEYNQLTVSHSIAPWTSRTDLNYSETTGTKNATETIKNKSYHGSHCKSLR